MKCLGKMLKKVEETLEKMDNIQEQIKEIKEQFEMINEMADQNQLVSPELMRIRPTSKFVI